MPYCIEHRWGDELKQRIIYTLGSHLQEKASLFVVMQGLSEEDNIAKINARIIKRFPPLGGISALSFSFFVVIVIVVMVDDGVAGGADWCGVGVVWCKCACTCMHVCMHVHMHTYTHA